MERALYQILIIIIITIIIIIVIIIIIIINIIIIIIIISIIIIIITLYFSEWCEQSTVSSSDSAQNGWLHGSGSHLRQGGVPIPCDPTSRQDAQSGQSPSGVEQPEQGATCR